MREAITFATKQGPRDYQEDFYFFSFLEKPNFRGWLMAVFDGHNGKEVAELCAKEIGNLFKIDHQESIKEALRNLVAELNSRTVRENAGSTLAIALIPEDAKKVSIAILGDSPVVVLDEHGKLHVSPEHNVRSNTEERKEAEKRGGTYSGGYIYANDAGLQLSRALGDAELGEVLSRTPEIYSIVDPKWVLVASDGVFDPAHGDMHTLLKEIRDSAVCKRTAEDIIYSAVRRGLKDNATALVWNRTVKRIRDYILDFLRMFAGQD